MKIPVVLFLIGMLSSCKTQKIQSTDLLSENSFTAGIEGPAVDAEGHLYAVNYQEEGTVGIVYENGEADVFLRLPGESVGNGIRFDQEGDMYIADYVGHNVFRVEKGTKKPVVWAHHPYMKQPNDLAIAPNGTIYLSDPNWAEGTGKLWMVRASKKDRFDKGALIKDGLDEGTSEQGAPVAGFSEKGALGENTARQIILLEDNMGTTNGIEVSPDGTRLYVNESVQRKVWQYDIEPDGSVSNKTLFLSFDDFGMDGMRCDMAGNLYITRYDKGTVAIASPDKKIIKEVRLKGKKPSNLTFGGPNGKTCFVTMADRGCFESFTALNAGAHYNRTH